MRTDGRICARLSSLADLRYNKQMIHFAALRRAARRLAIFVLTASATATPIAPAAAQEFVPFVVEDIRIDGLRRFDPGVVFNRLDIAIGDEMDEDRSIEIIKTLFDTGFFRSVEVLRDGGILVIEVEENSTIAEVNFAGVSELQDATLEGMLQSAGIVKARVFDRALVEAAVAALKEIYKERNFYKAEVNPVVSPLPRNRVAILFEVEEGKQASIRSIEIEGNEEFSNWTLRRAMNLEPRGLFNFFSDSYLFSEARLRSDLERIRTFYLEDGFLRFSVEEQRAEVSEDEEHIDVFIRVEEGRQYLLAAQPEDDADLFEGVIPEETNAAELRALISQVEGDVFSSREAGDAVARMSDLLGDHGYAFADVSYDNRLNDDEGTVEVIYLVEPGELVYVRNIVISGNERTRDEVVRREMLQFERERYSRKKVESSRRRIRRLGFFNDVVITRERVEGRDDEVDLAVAVREGGVGTFRVGAGFSTDNNLSFEAGLDTPNIFGSGNNFSADFSAGEDDKRINLSLDEFYHTDEGVSRHIGASIAERESSGESSAYNIDGFTADYGYGVPYADDGKYSAIFAYEKVEVNSISCPRGDIPAVTEVNNGVTMTVTPPMFDVPTSSANLTHCDFEDAHGLNLDALLLRLGLTHDTRDSFQQPTDGYRAEFSSEIGIPLLDLSYYRMDYEHDYYYQARTLWSKPVWHFRGGFGFGDGYGDGVYPFYERFFIGGTGTLRGFDTNSIGAGQVGGRTIGGRARAFASAEAAIDTELFKTQKVYLAPFLDAGVVGEDAGDLSSPRVSTGVELRWISPIGPLRFSWGKALIKKDGDKTQDLQFSIRY